MRIQSECCSRNNFHGEFAAHTEKKVTKNGVGTFKQDRKKEQKRI